ncbi:MAG: hypothetical protein HY905_14770 [Deltaproteobacteria bacterium]|nr:hypothetical protein [Deltaproteobacteria bacterium]
MIAVGPLVIVRFRLHPADERLRREGQETPADPVRGLALVDTGAQGTHVFESIPERFGLTPIRYVPVMGESRKAEDRPVYRMAVVMQMADRDGKVSEATFAANLIGAPSTFEPPGSSEPVIGLLGRDFLSHFDFHYHGATGEFELVRPDAPEARGGGDVADGRARTERSRKLTRKARTKVGR